MASGDLAFAPADRPAEAHTDGGGLPLFNEFGQGLEDLPTDTFPSGAAVYFASHAIDDGSGLGACVDLEFGAADFDREEMHGRRV
jgi:hypothetical protein